MSNSVEVQAAQWQRSVLEKHVQKAEKKAGWASAIRIGFWGTEVALVASAIVQMLGDSHTGALLAVSAVNFPFFLISESAFHVRQNMASMERNFFDHLYPQTMKSLGRPNK